MNFKKITLRFTRFGDFVWAGGGRLWRGASVILYNNILIAAQPTINC